MITSHEQAVEEMHVMLRDAWLADANTLGIPLLYDDVVSDPQGNPDPNNNPNEFLLIMMVHDDGSQQSMRSNGRPARHEYSGTLMANLHVPRGRGSIHSLPLISVAKNAFASQASPNGVWFRNTKIDSIGPQGAWYIMAMTTDFLYDLFA